MSKLTAVDKSMVSGRLSGLLTYSNFVHAVSGATVSINRLWNFDYSMSDVWNHCIYVHKTSTVMSGSHLVTNLPSFPKFLCYQVCDWLGQWLHIHDTQDVLCSISHGWDLTFYQLFNVTKIHMNAIVN